jgi:hypothetical protein
MYSKAISPGRTIGLLMLAEMILAPISNFVLLTPAIIRPPGFLTNAARHACEINVAVLLSLMAAGCSVGIAIVALPVLRRYSRAAGVWFLVLTVIGFAATLQEGIALRSMLALSQAFAQGGGTELAQFEGPRVLLRTFRNSTHYTNLLIGGCSLLLFYGALFRFRLVPRWIAAPGAIAAMLLIAAALMPLFGHATVMLLLMPMGLCHLALLAWLIARGFDAGNQPEVTT